MSTTFRFLAILLLTFTTFAAAVQSADKPNTSARKTAVHKTAVAAKHAPAKHSAASHTGPKKNGKGVSTAASRKIAAKKKLPPAKVRRMTRAFVASADLKVMARQLVQNRTPAAYNGVEDYARRHATSDAGALAWLAVGYARVQDQQYAQGIVALEKAAPRAGELFVEQDSVKGILHVSQGYLGGLNLFNKTGFWTVNPQDFSFELSLAGDEADGVILQSMVDGQIKAGRFAYALRQGTPVFFLLGNQSDPERGVLHSLAISSQVMGMFCGLLRREVAPAQEVAFSLCSMLLGASADALATLRRTRQLAGQIETLQNLLPVCAWCKKVRNDAGYWYQIEKYITANSRTKITHGICPECEAKMLRPEE